MNGQQRTHTGRVRPAHRPDTDSPEVSPVQPERTHGNQSGHRDAAEQPLPGLPRREPRNQLVPPDRLAREVRPDVAGFGDQQYPGRSPLSEPESQAVAQLIGRLRPTVTVWFHQPVGVIDQSGGSVAVERSFALIAGEPQRRLTRYSGSAVSWQNALLPGSTAFVVELPRTVTATVRGRMEAAVHDLAP